MTYQDLKLSHICVFFSFAIYAFTQTWQSSLLIISSIGFVAFELWTARTQDNRFKKMETELSDLRNRIEAVQIGRTLGR